MTVSDDSICAGCIEHTYICGTAKQFINGI
jgi:hypothetical protein